MSNITGLAEHIYDRIRAEKLYIGSDWISPTMDCWQEWLAVPRYKRTQLRTRSNSSAKRLDEWAAEFCISVSRLLDLICRAQTQRERVDLPTEDELYREAVQWESAISSIS